MNPSSNLEDVFYSVLKEAAIGQSPSLNLDNMLDIATLSGVLFNINLANYLLCYSGCFLVCYG